MWKLVKGRWVHHLREGGELRGLVSPVRLFFVEGMMWTSHSVLISRGGLTGYREQNYFLLVIDIFRQSYSPSNHCLVDCYIVNDILAFGPDYLASFDQGFFSFFLLTLHPSLSLLRLFSPF